MLKKISCLLLLGACISQVTLARPLSEKAGWRYTLSLSTLYSSSQSQKNTDSTNKVTEDLNNNGQSVSKIHVFPLGNVLYTLDDLKTQFYFNTNNAEQIKIAKFQYEFGVKHQFDDQSKLTFAAFPKLSLYNEVWSDPFLQGSERSTTKEKVGGARIAIEQILATPLTLKYAIASNSINNEKSGNSELTDNNELTLLRRDSVYQQTSIETMIPISEGLFLKPNFEYTERNAKGEANSYDDYALKLSLLFFSERALWVSTLAVGLQNYQQMNPIFDDKQDLKYASLFSVYTYKNPFNLKNWSWTMMAAYKQEQSDINFFDSRSMMMATGFTYHY